MKAPREAPVLRACLDYLSLRGIVAWRSNNAGVFDPVRKVYRTFHGRKGVADILGVLPPAGRLLAIECKSPDGKLTADQEAFLADVTRCGGLSVVARSVEDVEAALEAVT